MQTRIYVSFLIFAIFAGYSHIGSTQSNVNEFNVIETTIADIHRSIKSNEYSCLQITQAHINRINAIDKQQGFNAIILINPNAVLRAQQLDQKYAQNRNLGLLHCIPVILKDNFDTADMPTSGGSIVLKNYYPPDDAFLVKQLRNSDAIIVAKSNMSEWAFSPNYTISSSYGQTSNAYDTSRVPAGSGGGTASAIAASFGVIGMGTDTGNSIRGPSSHLALVGLRPTLGVTSRDGIIPLLLNRDIGGPVTRTVEETAIAMNVLAGYDQQDPLTNINKGRIPKDFTQFLDKKGLNGARIGVLRALIDTDTIDIEIHTLMEQAIDDLKRAGADIVDPFTIANFDTLRKATGFCSRFRWDLDHYLQNSGQKTPVKNLDQIVKSKQYHELSKGAMKWAIGVNVPPDQQEPPCVDVSNDPRRKQFLDAVLKAMNNAEVDALIYPTWNNPPRKHGDLTSPNGNNSPVIAPHTGQPAITVPMGFSSKGLPAGLQILGRPFDDALLIKFAYAYEQLTKHRHPPILEK